MTKKKKIFVLDTNVLIHRPDAILSFKESEVVIPLWVLEELDKLKSDHAERGRNARAAIRFLDEVTRHGKIHEGVRLENDSTLKIVKSHPSKIDADLDMMKMDNKIILSAYGLQQKLPDRMVFFVSKDINARVKASALGLRAVDYEKQKVNMSRLFSGYSDWQVDDTFISSFLESGSMIIENRGEMIENQFVSLKKKDEKTIHLGRYTKKDNVLQWVHPSPDPVLGITSRNIHQLMAFNLLLNDNIKLVCLIGKAGTGKTLLALAAGLHKVLNEKKYERVLVSRPLIPMGKDIGYLPGQKQEKMSHWMQPIFDNLELLITSSQQQNLKSIDQLLNNKNIEIEALTYIRGRSLPNQFIIIDEGQNLTPHEVKTIVSRAGEGTKVVITGDPYQIDSPYLDSDSNGMTYLVDAFRNQSLFGHVILGKSERSRLAELATELL